MIFTSGIIIVSQWEFFDVINDTIFRHFRHYDRSVDINNCDVKFFAWAYLEIFVVWANFDHSFSFYMKMPWATQKWPLLHHPSSLGLDFYSIISVGFFQRDLDHWYSFPAALVNHRGYVAHSNLPYRCKTHAIATCKYVHCLQTVSAVFFVGRLRDLHQSVQSPLSNCVDPRLSIGPRIHIASVIPVYK